MLLKKALEPVEGDYDLVLLDTVAAFDVLTLNAFAASTGLILSAKCDILSLNALNGAVKNKERSKIIKNIKS